MITLLSYNTLNIFEEVYTCVQRHARASSRVYVDKLFPRFVCVFGYGTSVYRTCILFTRTLYLHTKTNNTNVFMTSANLLTVKLDRV